MFEVSTGVNACCRTSTSLVSVFYVLYMHWYKLRTILFTEHFAVMLSFASIAVNSCNLCFIVKMIDKIKLHGMLLLVLSH